MQTASLVRTSATPIGRKFILHGQINNPTISATALSSITVVTQRVPLELLNERGGNDPTSRTVSTRSATVESLRERM